jgi:shikimate kinase
MGTRFRRVVLIGLRRSGKTTVGGVVATKTGWTLVDTDAIVQATTGRSPADWISNDGTDAFRKVESDAVLGLAGADDVVIATGGGVPLSQKNREILRPRALVVYLRADPWALAERARRGLSGSERPLLAGGSASEESFVLFAERDALYRSFCDLMVDATRPPSDVAAAVVGALAGDAGSRSG